MRTIRGLMVVFLASAAASVVYGQGMVMEWQAQIPPNNFSSGGSAFYYPVSCQLPGAGTRYRDSSLYDYDNDGVLDIIEVIDINDVSSNFLGDSIRVFDGATHQLKFDMYVNGSHVYNPCPKKKQVSSGGIHNVSVRRVAVTSTFIPPILSNVSMTCCRLNRICSS